MARKLRGLYRPAPRNAIAATNGVQKGRPNRQHGPVEDDDENGEEDEGAT